SGGGGGGGGGGRGCFGGFRELSVPDRVAQIFYSHGLFVSSHPWALISFVIAVVLLCCYPLLNLPLPGNVPQELLTSVTNYTVPGLRPLESGNYTNGPIAGKSNGESSVPEGQQPWWYRGSPVGYVQQIVVKTAVTPWTDDLILTDAFRAPLSEVFDLLEVIRNYQNVVRGHTLSQVCLHVEAVKTKSAQRQSMVLPEYNCLMLSPANLWQQDKGTFQADPTLLSTIFNYQSIQKGKISLAELLFGMSMKDTGIKRYPLRTRQRVVQYAITIILKDYDPIYLEGLKHKLTSLHPPEPGKGSSQNGSGSVAEGGDGGEGTSNPVDDAESILHIYYPGHFNLHRMFPLLATYVVLFLYIYFSVRKMELVRSKIGVALAAVATVLASLCMSVGLCFFFGLALSLDGGEGKGSARRDFYPYLVAVVGLENVLVLTRAAISTPPHLDTKIRIARALSREGWSITKNLLAEVTILTIGFFTFVPAIQEFCIFLVVGLLSDFFLQMMFFATVLAVDIKRLESLDAQHQRHHHYGHMGYPSLVLENQNAAKGWPSQDDDGMTSLFCPSLCFGTSSRPQKQKLSRSRSHPRLLNGGYPADVVATGGHGVTASPVAGSGKFASSALVAKLPKRLKLLYFWARTRIIQRAFMFGMVVWISVIVYNTGIVDRLAYVDQGTGGHEEAVAPPRNDSGKIISPPYSASPFVPVAEPEASSNVRHEQVWRNQGSSLSHRHWPALLGMYNISVSSSYLSILPPIRIWMPVAPDLALQMRHPEEKEGGPGGQFQWQALAAALDPLDFSELESGGSTTPSSSSQPGGSQSVSSTSSSAPYVPSSPMELFLTSVLCVVSVAVVSYTMVVLYRCVCSRNYAEWRASWSGEETPGISGQDASTQVVLEAVPLTLEGHPQEVECMANDPSGGSVASCCLSGQLRVWDRATGELLVFVDRKGFFSSQGKSPTSSAPHLENDLEEMVLSDYESGSPPSQGEGGKIASLYDLASPSSLSHRKGSFATNEMDCELAYPRGDGSYQKKDHHGAYLINGHGSYPNNQMMWSMPDLRPSINTNFVANRARAAAVEQQQNIVNLKEQGYDFGQRYRGLYEDHCKSAFEEDDAEMEEEDVGDGDNSVGLTNPTRNNFMLRRSMAMKVPQRDQGLSPDGVSHRHIKTSEKKTIGNGRARMPHNSLPTAQENGLWLDKSPPYKSPLQSSVEISAAGTMSQNGSSDRLRFASSAPPVWCIDFRDNLIALGCANGHLELWDGSSGKFKCLFEDGSGVGITSVMIIGNRVVAAKLSGSIDFFELESYRKGKQINWSFNSYHRRTHVRTGSAGSLDWDSILQSDEDIRCVRLGSVRAHQQPITVLDSEGGRILTGSQDHTLKVFRLEDHLQMYTLHGHCGPITALFIDKMCPLLSGSGSQDGMLCVWDLVTGACMYSIQAHDGSICALSYSASYVISLGTDERLCVWERFQGHLLNTIQVSHTYCSSMVMLTHNLLITSKQGSLVVWDVRTGDPVRIVRLGNCDSCIFVKQILLLRDGGAGGWGGEALCDYGNQLRIVRFPMASTEKTD
ncbi:sterol regulatory element-binding protein cleavage-activating protein, partial [Hetaerina americana]|uniref:sterol regulatory element-binding protein cleavage-activating protein n=1 Tax=Hetaerina americana TaxID=62018 RepID=UPI003A7F5DEA